MLYLTSKTSTIWRVLVRVLSQREPLDLVVCLYPGANFNDLPEPFSTDGLSENLERVTTYGDGEKPPCSIRFRVNDDLLCRIEAKEKELEKVCDNFALYRPDEITWLACTIPHEGMSLVREMKLITLLQANGLEVSEEPPSWW